MSELMIMSEPVYYNEIEQGTLEWMKIRCGVITASEVKHLLTTKGKCADNDKARGHIAEWAAQRITQHVEPQFMSDAMLRGHEDEIEARELYAKHYLPASQTGFVIREIAPGVTLGASPDGLVLENGLIEIKSRCQKYQVQTIASNEIPAEYLPQIQSQLLVTGRKWCDFISYCGGLPMYVSRVYENSEMQEQIIEAVVSADERIDEVISFYENNSIQNSLKPTVRRTYADII